VEGFGGGLTPRGEIRAGDPGAQGQDEGGGGAKAFFLLPSSTAFGPAAS
jgi:hypothetical protein